MAAIMPTETFINIVCSGLSFWLFTKFSDYHIASIFRTVDVAVLFLRNGGIYLQVHAPLQTRRPASYPKDVFGC